MNLENYLNSLAEKGFLKKEDIGVDQIKALLKGAQRNLSAAQKTLSIDEETCFSMAYNAILKISRAIVFLQGYRPDDGQQHKATIEAAGKILGEDFNALIDRFDKMRRKRNQFTYDPLAPLSKQEAENALKTAELFYDKIQEYFKKTNPQKELF